MIVKIVALTHHLILPDAFKRKKFSVPNFPEIRLEKNGDQLNFINEHMRYELGNMQIEEIKNNACFYTVTTLEEKDSGHFEQVFRNLVGSFIDSLWLIKDNSISSDYEFCRFDNGKSHYTRRAFINSNSHCEYIDVKFDKNELEDAIKWFNLLSKPRKSLSKINSFSEGKLEYNDGIINMDKNFSYENTNRFERALRFISVARKQTVLQPRITYYISAIESLLSTTDSELRMQVADRGARILGGGYEEKLRIKNIIGIAYSFRSKYIHGAVSSQKSMKKNLKFLESVEELSEEMDEILRELIKLFLTDLKHVVLLDEREFINWVDELLYK
ncbi:HEPN domain-containing protein [Planomicrobium okeanokoites]|uniref:HEPN domain-containing protein n=1 Tax=Planomicrobium okeanokoites TaxID=244 RepID=A0ABV7KL83_PLAOK|nr:HEPN domain-containing protein [Planomicrobium okeanokoites]TAA69382.1 hypothetical protein D2910_08565 [Planomicrobium okeanokoites]